MTAIPCGQKNNSREMIQSQIVTPPLAAIDGTTLRLKTATTKRRTRSKRPRTRRRCGAAASVETAVALEEMAASFDNVEFSPGASDRKKKLNPGNSLARASWGAAGCAPTQSCRPRVSGRWRRLWLRHAVAEPSPGTGRFL